MLTRELRDREPDGYIRRTVFPVRPLRVEYALTPQGRSVLGPCDLFREWALAAFDRVHKHADTLIRAPERNCG